MKIYVVCESNYGHTAKRAETAVAQHSMVWACATKDQNLHNRR